MNLKTSMQNFLDNPTFDNEKILINELKIANFLAPIMLSSPLAKPNGDSFYEEEGSNIKFIMLEDENSNLYYPAFTSRDELMKLRQDSEQEILPISLQEYANMLLNSSNKYSGVVIDAFSESLVLDMKFIRAVFKI